MRAQVGRSRLGDEVLERRTVDRHDDRLAHRDKGRGLRRTRERADLAEELARAVAGDDDVPVAFPTDLDLAVDDDEEAFRALALADDHLARLEREVVELGAERSGHGYRSDEA